MLYYPDRVDHIYAYADNPYEALPDPASSDLDAVVLVVFAERPDPREWPPAPRSSYFSATFYRRVNHIGKGGRVVHTVAGWSDVMPAPEYRPGAFGPGRLGAS